MMMREPTNEEATRRVEDAKGLLDEHDTLSLAICAEDGPWIAKAFFVEDEPRSGSLDVCCCLLLTDERKRSFSTRPRVSFIVGGDVPDRWVTGRGVAETVQDDADTSAIVKRLQEKAPAAGPFLTGVDPTAVRIHIERLRVTDLSTEPPVTEFLFA